MKLKPCPFCGAKTIDRRITHSNKCFIHKLIYMHSAGEVEEAWNTRVTDPLLKEMTEALEDLDDMFDPTSRVGEIIGKALQKYQEQVGE